MKGGRGVRSGDRTLYFVANQARYCVENDRPCEVERL